jgi:hypothetical protein
MTNLISAEFIRRNFGGHGYCRAKFCGRAEARPSKLKLLAIHYSPLAICYTLPSRLTDLPTSRFADKFRLSESLAPHFVLVLRPTTFVPLKVGA